MFANTSLVILAGMKSMVASELLESIQRLHTQGVWPGSDLRQANTVLGDLPDQIEIPEMKDHGDYSSQVALHLAQVLRASPMILAKQIAEDIVRPTKPSHYFEKVEVVAPGVLNFFLNRQESALSLSEILEQDEKYGATQTLQHQKIIIECIPGHQVGPLTLADGRGAMIADMLASVCRVLGAKVELEYSLGDPNVSMDILAESVIRYWLWDQGMKIDFPKNLYRGEYISNLVKQLGLEKHAKSSVQEMTVLKQHIKTQAWQFVLQDTQRVLKQKMHIPMDRYVADHTGDFTQIIKIKGTGQSRRLFEEVIDEAGIDAVRFFCLSYPANRPVDFDLEMSLVNQKNERNPMFVVQQTYANICAILEKNSLVSKFVQIDLHEQAEFSLAKHLLHYPEVLKKISQDFQVQALPQYCLELVDLFQDFYDRHPSSYAVLKATQIVLRNAFAVMGVLA